MHNATWTNGKKTLTGRWQYHWTTERFTILLDSKDSITGDYRRILVAGDRPEWGKWRLVRPER